jgi:hypothetical protein
MIHGIGAAIKDGAEPLPRALIRVRRHPDACLPQAAANPAVPLARKML